MEIGEIVTEVRGNVQVLVTKGVGKQRLEYGTGYAQDRESARWLADRNVKKRENGTLTWRDLVDLQSAKAFGSQGNLHLRGELLTLAATVVMWVEALDKERDQLQREALGQAGPEWPTEEQGPL